jgi:3-methyladenine DNA glycosylase AlkD
MSVVKTIQADLRNVATVQRAKSNAWFFKTGKGEYGEGDKFLGVAVPDIRKIVKRYSGDVSFLDIQSLIDSPFHEERLCGFLLLVACYEHGDVRVKKQSFDFYIKNAKRANNWDLVDLSASRIVGMELFSRGKGIAILKKLARSKNLWERRIAMISTLAFIVVGKRDEECFTIADMLIDDTHDLIHKAVGWMLREAGKRVSCQHLEAYLKPRYKTMPRTMLRYAIERFPEAKRKQYLVGEV